ncbi:hypothetical protein VL14_10045 [Cytobacillus firmus]|nr:hypothetical protein VL14_10045 [Cytobacillus firmus]
MRVLIFIVILILAALFSKGIEKVAGIPNKAFTSALYYLCLGIISFITYLLVDKDLHFLHQHWSLLDLHYPFSILFWGLSISVKH